MALVKCPSTFQLRRSAKSVGVAFGLRHFTCKSSHEVALLQRPCAFRLRRIEQSVLSCVLPIIALHVQTIRRIRGRDLFHILALPKHSMHSRWDPRGPAHVSILFLSIDLLAVSHVHPCPCHDPCSCLLHTSPMLLCDAVAHALSSIVFTSEAFDGSRAGITVLSCFVSSVLPCVPYFLCIPSRCLVSCIRVSNLCDCARCRAKPSGAFEASEAVVFRLSCLVFVYLALSKVLPKRPLRSDFEAALHSRCMFGSSSVLLGLSRS